MATVNKKLCLFDLKTGEKVVQAGQKSMADTHPVWAKAAYAPTLLYTRGPEIDLFNTSVEDGTPFKDRRIWLRTSDRKEKAVTSPVKASDYLAVSDTGGKGFFYLRFPLSKGSTQRVQSKSFLYLIGQMMTPNFKIIGCSFYSHGNVVIPLIKSQHLISFTDEIFVSRNFMFKHLMRSL